MVYVSHMKKHTFKKSFIPNNYVVLQKMILNYLRRHFSTGQTTRLYSISNLNDTHNCTTQIADIVTNKQNADILLIKNLGFSRYSADKNICLLKEFKRNYQQVIVVPGITDYHNMINYRREYMNQKMLEICDRSNVILLEKNDVYINNVHFIGAALWSLLGTQLPHEGCCYEWLKGTLDKYKSVDEKQVIVTHYLPKFSDGLHLKNVRYWFSGHAHKYNEFKYKRTNFIVNPCEQRKKKVFLV